MEEIDSCIDTEKVKLLNNSESNSEPLIVTDTERKEEIDDNLDFDQNSSDEETGLVLPMEDVELDDDDVDQHLLDLKEIHQMVSENDGTIMSIMIPLLIKSEKKDIAEMLRNNDYHAIPHVRKLIGESEIEENAISQLKDEMGLMIDDDDICIKWLNKLGEITKHPFFTDIMKIFDDDFIIEQEFFINILTTSLMIGQSFPDESEIISDCITYILESSEIEEDQANEEK